MKKNIIIGVLALVVIFFYLAYKGSSIAESNSQTRLEACRSLVMDLDTLLAETDSDYSNFIDVWTDLFNDNISYDKAYNMFETLGENTKRREFRYTNTIDKYNDLCFEL